MNLGQELLDSYRKQFAYFRHLGQAAMDQLSFAELLRDDEAGSNSIAVIVKHLAGNMRSRWTGLPRGALPPLTQSVTERSPGETGKMNSWPTSPIGRPCSKPTMGAGRYWKQPLPT